MPTIESLEPSGLTIVVAEDLHVRVPLRVEAAGGADIEAYVAEQLAAFDSPPAPAAPASPASEENA